MDLLLKLVGISQEDYSKIIDWIDECGIDEDKLITFIFDQIDEQETSIQKINLVALTLEYMIKEAEVPELIPYLNIDGDSYFTIDHDLANEIMSEVLAEDREGCWFELTELIGADFEE